LREHYFIFIQIQKNGILENTLLQFTHIFPLSASILAFEYWLSSSSVRLLLLQLLLFTYYLFVYLLFRHIFVLRNEFIYIHSCDNNAYTDFLFCFFWELVFIRVIGIYIFLCLFLCTLLWRKTYNLVSTHTRTHSYKRFQVDSHFV